jgi:hypothetical protein
MCYACRKDAALSNRTAQRTQPLTKGIAMLDGTNESERRETIDELADLMIVVQEMGRRLADETRGNASSSVRELNELLHQSRVQLQKIRDDAIRSA